MPEPVTPVTLSASQISVWMDCKRKWGWQYLAKIPRITHPSAALGTRVHTQLEEYLRNARPLSFTLPDGTPDESAYIAAPALSHLPKPGTPGLEIEQDFGFSSPRTGYIYRGFIDARVPDAVPVVYDHKTTSALSWAKTAEDLQDDVQANLYAVDTMARFHVPRVRLQWTYMQTKGARKCLPVITELESGHVADVFGAVEELAQEIATTLAGNRHVLADAEKAAAAVKALPPTVGACRMYGGCPYQANCNLSPQEIMRAAMSGMPSGTNALLEKLKGRTSAPAPVSTPSTVKTPSGTTTFTEAFRNAPSEAAQAVETNDIPINPPGEASPPQTAESRAAAEAEKPKRTRTRKVTEAPAGPLGGTIVVAETTQGPLSVGVVETSEHLIDVLFIDCFPLTDEGALLPGAAIIAIANERVRAETGKADYRFLEYGQGPGALTQAALAYLHQTGQTSVTLDTRTPEGAILCSAFEATAKHVVRGLR